MRDLDVRVSVLGARPPAGTLGTGVSGVTGCRRTASRRAPARGLSNAYDTVLANVVAARAWITAATLSNIRAA